MITLKQLIEAIRQVAATEPDFVYSSGGDQRTCEYTPNDRNRCGCIVGEALVLLGVAPKRLHNLDMLGYVDNVTWGAPRTVAELSDLVTAEALTSSWVRLVQEYQDNGSDWAGAVNRADERVGVPA